MPVIQSIDPFGYVGRPVVRVAILMVSVVAMVIESLHGFLKDSAQARRAIIQVLGAQLYFTAWQAMPLISLLAVVTGTVIILNTSGVVHPFGGGSMAGELLYLIVVKELGPLVVGFVVIARSGTAVASELGNMKANHEWDALRVMGINPLTFVVFPRLVAGVVSIFLLSFSFDVVAILGGYFMTALLTTVPFDWFMDSIVSNITLGGLLVIVTKHTVISTIIFSLTCFKGLTVKHSHHEVPQAVTKAVVLSIVAITLVNFTFTAFSFLIDGWQA